MTTAIDVKVTVTPEAAARVAELGFQKEFDQLIEHARTTIPGVRWIEVRMEPPYDTHDQEEACDLDSDCQQSAAQQSQCQGRTSTGNSRPFRQTCAGISRRFQPLWATIHEGQTVF